MQPVTDGQRNRMLRRALALVAEHSAVSAVEGPSLNAASSGVCVHVTFNVSLPSEWRQCGVSPSGVNLKETVRFDFPTEFPLIAPGLGACPSRYFRRLPHRRRGFPPRFREPNWRL